MTYYIRAWKLTTPGLLGRVSAVGTLRWSLKTMKSLVWSLPAYCIVFISYVTMPCRAGT